MRALALAALLLPNAAFAFECPAPVTAPVWQIAACELSGDDPGLDTRAARVLVDWGEAGSDEFLPVAAFWSLQDDHRITIVEWGEFNFGLSAAVLSQVINHGGLALTDAERDLFDVAPQDVVASGVAMQAHLLDLIRPILAERGLAALLLHLNGQDYGIAVVTEDYACRWDRVSFAEHLGWQRWVSSGRFESLPDMTTWRSGPEDCVVPVS